MQLHNTWSYSTSFHPSRVYGISTTAFQAVYQTQLLSVWANPGEGLKKATPWKAIQNTSGLWSNAEPHAGMESPPFLKNYVKMAYNSSGISFLLCFSFSPEPNKSCKIKNKKYMFPIRFTLEFGILKNSCLISLSPY